MLKVEKILQEMTAQLKNAKALKFDITTLDEKSYIALKEFL